MPVLAPNINTRFPEWVDPFYVRNHFFDYYADLLSWGSVVFNFYFNTIYIILLISAQ